MSLRGGLQKGWFYTKHQRWDNEVSKDKSLLVKNLPVDLPVSIKVNYAHYRDTVRSTLPLVFSPYIHIPGLRTKSGVKLGSSSTILPNKKTT